MPQIITDFYLVLFLESMKENGYLIFGIVGNFPTFEIKNLKNQLRPNQLFIDPTEIQQKYDYDKKTGKFKLNIGSGEQDAIDKACEESLRMFMESEKKKEEEEQKKKNDFGKKVLEQINMFQGNSVSLQSTHQTKCLLIRFW